MPKNIFRGDPGFEHGEIPAVGVLVANLGTPEAPTAAAVRPYLREFLSDPRVIELPRALWQMILNLFILPFRPKKSAELYASIWTDEGSPLLVLSRRLMDKIAARMDARIGSPIHFALGMTYGEPSMAKALAELQSKGCRRVVVLPLYPQYSSTSTGAVFDAVMKELMTWRWVPEIRTLNGFHDDPAYIRALARSIRALWEKEGEPDKLVLSYHGIPERYFLGGDPYHCFCHKTSRLIAEELDLPAERWMTTFQSVFGKEPWIKPPTDHSLEKLAKEGVRSVDVICPGFSLDCLETLEEIDGENREVFLEAGGERFRYIPCLNDSEEHADLLADVVLRNLGGWVAETGAWDQAAAAAEARMSRERADALVKAGTSTVTPIPPAIERAAGG